jgi:hypothetical protein
MGCPWNARKQAVFMKILAVRCPWVAVILEKSGRELMLYFIAPFIEEHHIWNGDKILRILIPHMKKIEGLKSKNSIIDGLKSR